MARRMPIKRIIWSNKHGTTEHEFEKPVGIWEALTRAHLERRDAEDSAKV